MLIHQICENDDIQEGGSSELKLMILLLLYHWICTFHEDYNYTFNNIFPIKTELMTY